MIGLIDQRETGIIEQIRDVDVQHSRTHGNVAEQIDENIAVNVEAVIQPTGASSSE